MSQNNNCTQWIKGGYKYEKETRIIGCDVAIEPFKNSPSSESS